MKKIFLVLISFFMLTGCSNSKLYKIELEANATTGYTWRYELSNEGIINVVTDEYKSNDNPDNLVGVGGKQIYEIRGLKEGDVTITFTYAQAWDSENPPADVKVYNLKVDKDLNITKIN